jgi:uncharacterized protein (DUF111 family)
MVKCAHGELPVPAPAVLILVEGMPVKTGGFNREMTTPTGAGILAASVDEFISGAGGVFKTLKTGYGTGTRRMEKPNLLRISLRETEEGSNSAAAFWKTEILTLMEANIDDMNGEEFGFLMERLFESGALDVTFSPCTMKKSRPGTLVSILAPPAKLEELRLCLFTHSRSIGFRETEVTRLCLERDMETLSGSFGEARRKTACLGGKVLRSKIEYEDRARIAREKGISLAEAEALIKGTP